MPVSMPSLTRKGIERRAAFSTSTIDDEELDRARRYGASRSAAAGATGRPAAPTSRRSARRRPSSAATPRHSCASALVGGGGRVLSASSTSVPVRSSSPRRRRQQLAVGRARSSSSSRWSPTWVIVPSWSSATRSASSTVEARWATTRPVVVGEHPAQRLLDQRLGVDVERREGVVEHQHPRLRRARRGPARGAAAGRRRAPCPARRSGCRGPRAGRGRSRPGRRRAPSAISSSVALGPAQGEVLAGAHREQRRLLERRRHQRAQVGEVEVADVDAVDGHPARR